MTVQIKHLAIFIFGGITSWILEAAQLNCFQSRNNTIPEAQTPCFTFQTHHCVIATVPGSKQFVHDCINRETLQSVEGCAEFKRTALEKFNFTGNGSTVDICWVSCASDLCNDSKLVENLEIMATATSTVTSATSTVTTETLTSATLTAPTTTSIAIFTQSSLRQIGFHNYSSKLPPKVPIKQTYVTYNFQVVTQKPQPTVNPSNTSDSISGMLPVGVIVTETYTTESTTNRFMPNRFGEKRPIATVSSSFYLLASSINLLIIIF